MQELKIEPHHQASSNPNCRRCSRPMRLAGAMPRTTNLPGVYTYRCDPCDEIAVFDDRQPGS
jgi:hypothetical protein